MKRKPGKPFGRAAYCGRRKAVRAVLTLVLSSVAWQAWGACSVNTQALGYGDYNVFSNQHLESVATISITCDAVSSYDIALSPGGSGSYAARSMANGAHRLNYNLYTDAARNTIWGDGTSGTVTVSGTFSITSTASNHTIYGRIPARQNAYIGSYSDTVTVTVSF